MTIAILHDPACGVYSVRMNRPSVAAPAGTARCRSSEAVPEPWPEGWLAAFAKEDGEFVVDHGVRRA